MPAAQAVETGIESSPIGLHAIGAGLLPPKTPNGYLDIRGATYTATTLKDGNGNTSRGPNRVEVQALAFKYVRQTDLSLWGGNYFWGVAVPLVKVKAEITVPGFVVGAPVPFVTLSGKDSGVGNVEIDAGGVHWDLDNLFITSKLTFGLPTGSFDAKQLANVGTKRAFVGPRIGAAYFPGNGWVLSQELRLDFNKKNNDTGYRSGHEMHLDLAVSKRFEGYPAFELGLAGYIYRQLGNDRSGTPAPASGRARVQGLGPAFTYLNTDVGVWVSGNYAVESGARNRFEGRRFWLRSGILF